MNKWISKWFVEGKWAERFFNIILFFQPMFAQKKTIGRFDANRRDNTKKPLLHNESSGKRSWQCNRSCSRYPPSCHVVSQTAKHRRSKNTVKTLDALLLLGKNTEFQKSLPWKGPWLIKKTWHEKTTSGLPFVPKTFHARFAFSVNSRLWPLVEDLSACNRHWSIHPHPHPHPQPRKKTSRVRAGAIIDKINCKISWSSEG